MALPTQGTTLEAALPIVQYQGLNTLKASNLAGMLVDTSGNVTVPGTMAVTGAQTFTGNLGVAGTIIATTDTLTGAGAVSVTALVTKIVTTGANALTLANGADGQLKFIVMTTDGGDGTLTPTTKTGFSTITFNDAGDGVGLVYTTTTGWIVFANNGATIA